MLTYFLVRGTVGLAYSSGSHLGLLLAVRGTGGLAYLSGAQVDLISSQDHRKEYSLFRFPGR